MPILSGVTVYRISDLPLQERPPRSAFFEIAYDNANYRVPVAAVGVPDDTLVVGAGSGPVDAEFDTIVLVTVPRTIRLPVIASLADAGRRVVVKRLYSGSSDTVVQSQNGTMDNGSSATDVLDTQYRSVVYRAVVTQTLPSLVAYWVRT